MGRTIGKAAIRCMRLAALLVCMVMVLLPHAAFAQDDMRAGCDSCRFRIHDLGQPFALHGSWLFTRDDDPDNKEYNRDTRDWKLLRTPGPWRKAYADGKNFNVGWYRATLEFDDKLIGEEVVLLLDTYLARTSVYLDGHELFRRPGDANYDRIYAAQPIPVRFQITGPRHVLAIRVDTTLMTGIYALPLELRAYVPNDPGLGWHQLRGGELRLLASILGSGFGLFFLFVFARTRYGMYLYAGLGSLCCSLYLGVTNDLSLRVLTPETALVLSYMALSFAYFFFLFVQYFHTPMPRINRALAAPILVLNLLLASQLVWPDLDLFQWLRRAQFVTGMGLGTCIVYMMAQSWRKGRPNADMLFAGFAIFYAVAANDTLMSVGLVQAHFLMPFGLMAALAAVLYVTSNSFTHTFSENKKLLATLKEKNAALQAEQARTAIMLRMVPDLFSVSRMNDGSIVTVNEGFSRLSGWKAEEAIGHSSQDLGLWPPGERERFVSRLAQTGSISDLECAFIHRDGHAVDGQVSATTFSIDGVAHIAMTVRDMSASRKQENALRHSYDLLAKIQNNAGMAIWQWNPHSGEIFWSQTAYAICHITPRSSPDLPPGFVGVMRVEESIDIIHPDDRQRYVSEIESAMHARQGCSHQYRVVCGDGDVRCISAELFLELDEEERILYVYGLLRDITERVVAEEALRTSQEKLSAIYNTIPDQISVIRLTDQVIVDVNEATVRIHELAREELVGRRIGEIGFWTDRADYERYARILVAQGKVDAFECYNSTRSGRVYRSLISSRPCEFDGVTHVLSICRDITELHRQQIELQRSYDTLAKIQRNAGMGLCHWNPHTDELLFSQTALDLFGYPPESTDALPPGFAGRFKGSTTFNHVHAEDLPSYMGAFEALLRDKQSRTLSFRITRGDGETRAMHSELQTECDGQNHVISVYGFVKDITAQTHTDEELAQHRSHLEQLVAQRTTELQNSYTALTQANLNLRAATVVAEAAQHAAESANRMKSDFLAMISHEMRTPLGGVIGMIKLGLKDSRLIAETRGKFNVGLASAEGLLQIINDILDYSKLEAGKMKMEHIDFDLPATLQDSHSILEERADAKGLALLMEMQPELPRWWQGDPVRLRQVLINLMGNAIKFTEHGSVLLTLNQEENGWLEFAVADTGVGIPADALPRMFQKFEQADVSTTRKFGGTGLGLAICKHIVEAMGGTIGVTSTPGAGTTFRFRLPLHEGKKPEIVETVASSRHTHRLSILCAEDGKTNQLIVRELVESMGHHIELVENGLEALRALSTRHYNMVLMDMRMPEMDGMEATQLIRAGGNERYIVLDPALPIVALTANVMEEDRQRYLQAGMDGFLGKPIDEAALFGELAKVITRLLAQGVELAPLTDADTTPTPSADVVALDVLDALFGVDSAALPAPQSPVPVQAAPISRQSVSQRTWNAMIEVFRSEAPLRLARLKTALGEGDASSAALELHTLKGSAGHLQGLELRALCSTLEVHADAGDLHTVARHLPELEQHLTALLATLEPV